MNFAISRVLVPVDFSPHSESALRYAAALAGRLGALVEILHVVEEPITAVAAGSQIANSAPTELRSDPIVEAERQLDRYRPITEGSHVHALTTGQMGPPAQTITAYARASGVDLIVMGMHGQSGLSHPLLGSVAEGVVRGAPCPVLTVPELTIHAMTVTFGAESAVFRSALGRCGTSRE
jgi:nucleotide-binding universal stress UspA family protein